jgi:hypothetical protein
MRIREELERDFISLMVKMIEEAIKAGKVTRLETHADALYMGWANVLNPSFKANVDILISNIKALRLSGLEEALKIKEEADALDFTRLTPKEREIGANSLLGFFQAINGIKALFDSKNAKRGASNTDLQELFGLSINTQADWVKKDESDWRKKVHTYLKSKTKEELTEELARLNLL